KRSTSSSTASSSSSTGSLTPTPEPYVPSNVQRRRSLSPRMPPPMSPDNGRPLRQPPPPPPMTNSKRIFDERRYSPDALERQLNAELHLLDGVEASMKQIDNMERLRSVTLAQQEIVSLAQVLKNKPTTDSIQPQQPIRRPAVRQASPSSVATSTSSSSSSGRKRRPPSTQQPPSKHKSSHHHRNQQSSGTSSPTPS
ncbi:unnamed protein product, partial [Rotaria magnacalcarata]